MNIVLCGLPMCGKSVVGKAIAAKLNLPYVETDQMIEDAYEGKYNQRLSCRQISADRGESFFRLMEKEQIGALKDLSHSVISLGGGSLTDNDNIAVIRKLGKLIYLKADPVSLWKRTGQCGIPSYLDPQKQQEAFYIMAQHRMGTFSTLCDVVVETGQHNIENLADEVIRKIYHGQ